MNSSTLRQLWTVIEETQTNVLLKLSDADLVKQLLSQLDHRKPLSGEEAGTISQYLHAKTTLIRDLAQSRRG